MALIGPDREDIDAAKKAIQRDVLIRHSRGEKPFTVPAAPEWQKAKAELAREDGFVSFDLDAAHATVNGALAALPQPVVKDVFTVAGILLHALERRSPLALELVTRGLNQEQEFKPQTIQRAINFLRENKLVARREGALHDLTGELRPKNRADRAYVPPADPDLSIAAARAEKAERQRQAAIAAAEAERQRKAAAAKAEAERQRKAAEAARAAEEERQREEAEAAAQAEEERIAAEAEAKLVKHADWLLSFAAKIESPTLTDAADYVTKFDRNLDADLLQPAMARLYAEGKARVDTRGVIHRVEPKPEPTPDKAEPKEVVKTETTAKTAAPETAPEAPAKKAVETAPKRNVPAVDSAVFKAMQTDVAETKAAVTEVRDAVVAKQQELTYAGEKLREASLDVRKTLQRLCVLLEVRGVTNRRHLLRTGLSQPQMAALDAAVGLGVLIGAVREFGTDLALADPYKVFPDRRIFHHRVNQQHERDLARTENPGRWRKASA